MTDERTDRQTDREHIVMGACCDMSAGPHKNRTDNKVIITRNSPSRSSCRQLKHLARHYPHALTSRFRPRSRSVCGLISFAKSPPAVHTFAMRTVLSFSDLEVWTITLTYELDLDSDKIKQCAKYTRQRAFRYRVIVRIHRDTRTQSTDCITRPLKQSVIKVCDAPWRTVVSFTPDKMKTRSLVMLPVPSSKPLDAKPAV